MQFDFLPDLTDKVRVEAIQHVAHAFYLLETGLLLVQFLDLIVKANDLLFELFVIGQVAFPKLYEIVCLPVGFIRSAFELG